MRHTLRITAVVLLLTLAGAPDLRADPRIKPAHVTSEVHPGDPLQEIVVAGFATQAEALRFVAEGFSPTAVPPKLTEELTRGRTVSFAGASYLVFYHVWEGKPALLALTRVHADLHLLVGSCGFQMTLGVRTPASLPPLAPKPEPGFRER